VHIWWREQCVSSKKKLLFVMQNLGIWGIMGTGSKYVVESAIFGIADPDLPIHYATFMGLQWWLRVVYSWVPPLLSIFGRRWSWFSVHSCKAPYCAIASDLDWPSRSFQLFFSKSVAFLSGLWLSPGDLTKDDIADEAWMTFKGRFRLYGFIVCISNIYHI